MDLTGVTTTVTGVQGDITAVGLLIIATAAIAMGVRWVKATFF